MVTLVGNLCSNPELKKISANNNMPETQVCTFRVACDRKIPTDRTDENGRIIYDSTDVLYIGVECWGALAANAKSTLNVGSPVIISGKLLTSSWEEPGEDKAVKRSIIRCRAYHIGPNLARESFVPLRNVLEMAEDTAQDRLKKLVRMHQERQQQPQSQEQNAVKQEQVRANPSGNAA